MATAERQGGRRLGSLGCAVTVTAAALIGSRRLSREIRSDEAPSRPTSVTNGMSCCSFGKRTPMALGGCSPRGTLEENASPSSEAQSSGASQDGLRPRWEALEATVSQDVWRLLYTSQHDLQPRARRAAVLGQEAGRLPS